MRCRIKKLSSITFLLMIACAIFADRSSAQKTFDNWKPDIPKTWVDAEIAELEVPLANPIGSPKHISADYYYRIPVRKIYRSYPVYAPGKEPPGYMDWLKQQEPEIAFDPARLKTEADWTKAGELVFDAPLIFGPPEALYRVRDPEWVRAVGAAQAKDGTLPYLHYVIREKGKVEIGDLSCALCHTRVMPDGSVIKGAQGNFPFIRALGLRFKNAPDEVVRKVGESLYGAPWLKGDNPTERIRRKTAAEVSAESVEIPPGVIPRHRTSPVDPVQVPDLIGVKDRKYLDRTGLQLHRSLVDIMRYAALNQGGDALASFDGFIPAAEDFHLRPDPSTQERYSDEQLYALALYLYSLKPPPNPNKFDALAQRGQKIFDQQGCARCHTPPLYTSNKLTPVDGFTVPEEHKRKYDILPMSVGTDPNLALKTRRGTGYYKVPSLKGVWYRGPFEHNGSVATLEDWFDAKRLRDDYVPTGFKWIGSRTRAVKGHEFGLQLSAEDKRALIAFLKTL
jgi:hypothetical protein